MLPHPSAPDLNTDASLCSMDSATDISPLLSAEQKELRRVFDYLCNFLQKNALRKQMQPKLERCAAVCARRWAQRH